MKKRRSTKTRAQETENMKVLKNFFEKSIEIIDSAIKESHRKHPELFKSS